MAIAVPHQPRYQRRGPYIYYLLGERMVIRTRPARVRDPRTPAQRRQRLRMRVASTFLKGFQPIVSRGFEPQLQENFRKVGAYQQALGHLMQHALRNEKGGVTLDTARVQLAQGRPSPLGAVRATVQGGLLRLAWAGALPPKTAGVLLGVWNRGKARALCREAACAPGARGLSVAIPPDWQGDTLDVWVVPQDGQGRCRYDSAHCATEGAAQQAMPGGRLADMPRGKWVVTSIRSANPRRVRVADVYSGRRRE